MLKSYSDDLRWRAVWQCRLQNNSMQAVVRGLYIAPQSVERWVKLFDTTRNVRPKESTHEPPCKLSEFEELTVLQTLLTNSGVYLH